MTFKIKLLSAAAILGLPAVALAQQQQQPQTGTTMQNVTQAVQNAQDAQPPADGEQVADERPRRTARPAAQPAQQPPVEANSQGQPQTTPPVTPPAATPPAQTPPAGAPPAETPPSETPPVTPPAATPPAETPPTETPPVASPPAATPPADTPPTGTQADGPAAPASAQGQANAQAGSTGPATAADIRVGVEVRDTSGALVGTVESADADSAIVSTGSVRADIPIASFGRNAQGLVLAMTRAQLEAAARARTPTP